MNNLWLDTMALKEKHQATLASSLSAAPPSRNSSATKQLKDDQALSKQFAGDLSYCERG